MDIIDPIIFFLIYKNFVVELECWTLKKNENFNLLFNFLNMKFKNKFEESKD